MKSTCPTLEELSAVLMINGLEPGFRKHVLDSGWWVIDESEPIRKRIPNSSQPSSVGPAMCHPDGDPILLDKVLTTARNDGRGVIDGSTGTRIDLGGRRRAKAGFAYVNGRGPSLFVEIPTDPGGLSAGTAAFVLRLTAFMRRVRASLLDLGHGVRLVWEVPLDPADDSEEQLLEALCCLSDAVQHGQAEAEMLNRDESTAARWLEMNFPPINQH